MTTEQVVVYAGPTIGAADIRAIIPDAEVRVPVARGDLMEGPWRPGDTAVLIDGFFRERRSVGHKEILWLLGQGVDVIGTASMGALRAAELAPYGMRGLGTVYDMYASGAIDGDDEVGVLHGPAAKGYPAQTVALVNLRYGAAEGARSGLVPKDAGCRIVDAAKALPFTSRSWSDLDSAVDVADRAALGTLRRLIEAGAWDVKRLDATEALRSVGTRPAVPPDVAMPEVFLTGIAHGQRISRQSKREYAPGRWMSDLDVLDAARLFDDSYPDLHREVLTGLLAGLAAADGRTLADYAEHKLGAGTGPLPDQLACWLTEAELARLSPEELLVSIMVRVWPAWRSFDWRLAMVDRLRASERWGGWQDLVAQADEADEVARYRLVVPPPALCARIFQRHWSTRGSSTEIELARRGFTGPAELGGAVTRFFAYDVARTRASAAAR